MSQAHSDKREQPAAEEQKPRTPPKRAVTEEIEGPAPELDDWPWPDDAPGVHDA